MLGLVTFGQFESYYDFEETIEPRISPQIQLEGFCGPTLITN